MARISGEKQYNSFIRGVITESNPLTYPENASLDEDNFVLFRDGSRKRRLGVDYEEGYSLIESSIAEAQLKGTRVSFHQWDRAGGSSVLGIVRIYNRLWFVDLLKANPSAYLKNSGNPITITGLTNSDIEVTSVNNNVVLVSKDIDYPILLEYNKTTDTVTQSQIQIKVRDLWGVDDGLAVDNRPTALSNTHHYNLKNQGWINTIQNSCGSTPIDCTKSSLGVYPSNADIWTLGKEGDSTSANFEKYTPSVLARNSYDNAPAPKGKYIIDIYNRGTSRTTASSVSGLPTDQEIGRISTVTSFAGRVFYSGVESNISGGDARSPRYSGYVFFTKTVLSPSDLSVCYQEADPTSENISDIIQTDGGTIQLPEASQIVRLLSANGSLVVFAENGIWEVYGGDTGFTATNYQLHKITDSGISNPKSVVFAGSSILYWSRTGISVLTVDKVSGRLTSQSLSLLSVQTFFNQLPEQAKENAIGFYDEKEFKVRWLYNDDTNYDGILFRNKYTKELVYDVALQAFYKQSISSLAVNSPYIAGYVTVPNYAEQSVADAVYVGTDPVTVGGVEVTANVLQSTPRGVNLKYLTLVPGVTYKFTMSEYNNTSFVDWKTADSVGVDFTSYLVTGHEIFGDILRKKQVPYILFFFKRTEDGFDSNLNIKNPSSCYVSSRWEWTDSAASGRWGSAFQAYKLKRPYFPSGVDDPFDYGEEVIVTKNKLRGFGRSLSLYISSETGKDMHLLGWALLMSGNSYP